MLEVVEEVQEMQQVLHLLLVLVVLVGEEMVLKKLHQIKQQQMELLI